MAKKARRKARAHHEETFGEAIELPSEEQHEEQHEEQAEETPTFAEAEGLPANKHAKALAKKQSAAKKKIEDRGSFYTLKSGHKVVKMIVKKQGVHEVYIGNLKRHKDGLDPMMETWKKHGVWIEPHMVEAQIKSIRAELK